MTKLLSHPQKWMDLTGLCNAEFDSYLEITNLAANLLFQCVPELRPFLFRRRRLAQYGKAIPVTGRGGL
jgi:hypothetical protein